MHKLVAHCPSCKARYNVTQKQLEVADGRVRCGQCLTVFHVTRPQPDHTQHEVDPLMHLQQMRPDPPDFSTHDTPNHSPQTFAMIVSFLALLLLTGQFLWFERARLSQDPTLYPLYSIACEQLNCSLPSIQSLPWIETSHLMIRPQVEQPDILELQTGLINTGPLPIPLPMMRLHFTDSNGHILAASDFPPNVYLVDKNITLIQPGQKHQISLLIQRPAPGHLGYKLDWLPVATR